VSCPTGRAAGGGAAHGGGAGPGDRAQGAGSRPDTFVVVDLVERQQSELVSSFDLRTDAAGRGVQRFLVPGDSPPGDLLLIATSRDRSETAMVVLTVLPSSNCAPDQQPRC
jgi:hypothetical protein